MRNHILLVLVIAFCARADDSKPSTTVPAETIIVEGSNVQRKGWGVGGWGTYRIVLKNQSSKEITVVNWAAHWEDGKGNKIGNEWVKDSNKSVLAGAEFKHDEKGVMSGKAAEAARPGAPVIAGQVKIREGETTRTLPFSFEVPVYALPEPLKQVDGETVALSVMESRYKNFSRLDRTLKWLDQSYAAMIDLTGEKPFGGKKMVFKESPPHPWWAYAGQEMILNTEFVETTLKDFDQGVIAFGWIHEVGHNFDVLGDWYIWNGPAAEFQANFKLAYALETIPDQSFRVRWSTFQAPGYPAPDKNTLVTGTEFVERFFVVYGDRYLADTSRNWESMTSDDMHSFFQRIQRCYSWDLYKRWFRSYRLMKEAGMKPPKTPEDKVNLIAAILNQESGANLTPLFQRWRFPVTEEKVKAMKDTYLLPLKKTNASPVK